MNKPGSISVGICNADGLGKGGSARASPAPSCAGRIQRRAGSQQDFGGEEPRKKGHPQHQGAGSFHVAAGGVCPLRSGMEMLHGGCQAETQLQPLIETLKFS